MVGIKDTLAKFTQREGSLLPIAFFRIIMGFMLWRHAWFFIDNHVVDRFYQDKFFFPYFDWYPLPSEAFYIFILVIMIISGLFLIIGFRSKEAAIAALLSVLFHLFLNQVWYRHNRYFFLLMLLLLAISPAYKVFSSRTLNSTDWGKTWTYFMIRLQMSFTYLASAFAKTTDPDWIGGNVMKGRLNGLMKGDNMGDENLPFVLSDWWTQIIRSDLTANIMTTLALGQEYFLALALWIPQTRKLALWVGLIFHASIEFGANVLVFSYASLATYFVVINPTIGDRQFYFNPEIKSHVSIVQLIAHLDWLNKITFQEIATPECQVRDADGSHYRGWLSLAIVGSCMVLPFGIAYPLTWLKHFGVGKVIDTIEHKNIEITNLAPQWSFKKTIWTVMALFSFYQLLLWVCVNRLTKWDLQDLSVFDSIFILIIFYLVATFYQRKVIIRP